jgi:hypothetical protein
MIIDIHGADYGIVKMATRLLAEAFFESGFDVISFVKKGVGHVIFDKNAVNSKDVSSCDGFVLLNNETGVLKNAKEGAFALYLDRIKMPSLKKYKTKNYHIVSEGSELKDEDGFMACLGGLVKILDKLSMKSMKMSFEVTLGREKRFFDALELGYTKVKMVRNK